MSAGTVDGAVQAAVKWGRQAIVFGLCLRADQDGEGVNSEERVLRMNAATDRVVQELWDEAVREATMPPAVLMKFVGKVFDWVEDHRRS